MRYKPVPRNRCIHQIITTDRQSELYLRDLSCYSCEQCSEGDFKHCSNPLVGGSRTHVMEKEVHDETTHELDSSDGRMSLKKLLQPNTIVALFTDDPNFDYYLMKITADTKILKHKIKDDWGITHDKGTEIVKGYYFENQPNKPFKFRLVKNVLACAPVLSVKHILIHSSTCDTLELSEADHLDILDSMED